MSNTSQESAVEDKRNSKNSVSSRKNDWKGFGYSVINNLFFTFFIALIGANFIYFTSLRTDALDFLFPSNLPEYFSYAKVPLQSGGKCSFGDREAFSSTLLADKVKKNLGKIGIPPSQGWPYSMNDNGDVDFSLQGFKNWFTLVNVDVYSVSRSILKLVFEFFNKETDHMFSSDLVQICFITFLVPLILVPTIIFVPWLLFACIFIASCLRAWNSSSILFFLVTFFFGPAFFLSAGITAILPLQLLLTLLVLPPYADREGVYSIMKCNGFLFTTLFLLFTTMSAFKNELHPLWNAGLVIATGLSLGPHIFKSLNKARY